MNPRETLKRVLVALIAGPVFLGFVYVGRAYFVFIMDIIIGVSLWELYGLAELQGYLPSKKWGIFFAVALSWGNYFLKGGLLHAAVIAVVMMVLLLELFKAKPTPLANASMTLLGIVYVSLYNAFICLRQLPLSLGIPYSKGGWLVMALFTSIWLSDTAAYFVGSRFGRHPLFPRVSPLKSWEGAYAGFAAAVISSLVFTLFLRPYFTWFDGVCVGAIIGLAGPFSDLIESLFKRDSGVKDSSALIPGHGGMLDRFDSALFIGVMVYGYYFLTRLLL